jgi:hypothetical protein
MKHLLEKIRVRWLAYLDKLAKANEETYGSQRLDCCDLNSKQKLHNNFKK